MARKGKAARATLISFNPGGAQEISEVGASFGLVIPPPLPLKLVGSNGPSGEPPLHFQYNLRNTGVKPIVALAIKWNVSPGQGSASQLTSLGLADFWLGGLSDWLDPGRDRQFFVSGGVKSDGTPLNKLEGTVVYVEFNDGTRLGSEASSVLSNLTQRRQAILNEYQGALDAYNSSGEKGLTAQLLQARTSTEMSPAYSYAATTLLAMMDQKGLDAVVAELKRGVALNVPQ